MSESSDGTIANCINNGSVTANFDYARVGGIVGYSYHSEIISCINTGTITAIGNNVYIGGLVGDYYSDKTINNSYSILGMNNTSDLNNGEICTAAQLNSKEFYTETLGWSEDIWDFSELDVENSALKLSMSNFEIVTLRVRF